MTQNNTDSNEQQGEALLCEWCAKGDRPNFLDSDGTLVSITGRDGILCHAHEEYWWPCLKFSVEFHCSRASIPAVEGDALSRAVVEAAVIDHVADENWPDASVQLSNAVEQLLEHRAELGLSTLCQHCRQSVYRSIIDNCWFHTSTHNSICGIVSSTVLKATPLRPTKPAPLPPTIYMGFADDADMLAEATSPDAASSPAPAEPVQPWRDEGGHAWEIKQNVTCVECPHCCFTFAAVHTDGNSDGYSCPNCEGCPDAAPIQPDIPNHALVQLLESALLHPESAEGNIRQVIETLNAAADENKRLREHIADLNHDLEATIKECDEQHG